MNRRIRRALLRLIVWLYTWRSCPQPRQTSVIEARIQQCLNRVALIPAGDQRAYWLNRLNELERQYPRTFSKAIRNASADLFAALTIYPVENTPRRPDPYYRPLSYLFA